MLESHSLKSECCASERSRYSQRVTLAGWRQINAQFAERLRNFELATSFCYRQKLAFQASSMLANGKRSTLRP